MVVNLLKSPKKNVLDQLLAQVTKEIDLPYEFNKHNNSSSVSGITQTEISDEDNNIAESDSEKLQFSSPFSEYSTSSPDSNNPKNSPHTRETIKTSSSDIKSTYENQNIPVSSMLVNRDNTSIPEELSTKSRALTKGGDKLNQDELFQHIIDQCKKELGEESGFNSLSSPSIDSFSKNSLLKDLVNKYGGSDLNVSFPSAESLSSGVNESGNTTITPSKFSTSTDEDIQVLEGASKFNDILNIPSTSHNNSSSAVSKKTRSSLGSFEFSTDNVENILPPK
mmetsp:Transcript_7439/g.9680  ORF Transcript_7439/g.9680 Transcript_7439/m.9680 type:complete len:280 (+) Transcript_7439:2121-2960(+)